MPPEPVPADPGWDGDPAWRAVAPDSVPADDELSEEGWLDPEDGVPPPGEDVLSPELADAAAGDDDDYDGASDAELAGVLAAEAGGRTCLCNTGPKCRHDHRLKQHPRWKADQLPDGTFRWTTPSGRTYTTEPTRYPI